MEWASSESEAEQQGAGRVFVVGIVLDQFRARARFLDFKGADVSFDHAFQGVTAQYEIPIGKLSANLFKCFQSSLSPVTSET